MQNARKCRKKKKTKCDRPTDIAGYSRVHATKKLRAETKKSPIKQSVTNHSTDRQTDGPTDRLTDRQTMRPRDLKNDMMEMTKKNRVFCHRLVC